MPENLSSSANLEESDPKKTLPPLSVTWDNSIWWILTVAAVVLSLYHIFYAYERPVTAGEHTVISMGLSLTVFLLSYLVAIDRQDLRGKVDSVLTAVMIVAALGLTWYFFSNYIELTNSLLSYEGFEYVLALAMILVVTEATRRAYGLSFTIIVVASILYAYLGPSLGPVAHSGATPTRILESFVLTLSGIYGFIPKVGAIWIVLFLVFAGLLEGYGALSLFISLGSRLSAYLKVGVSQIAIVASLLMGSISGSAAANTATTGAFTIPLMEDQGIRSRVAAAIEASASSGGQVMPPVMGASAFVMASILDIPYLRVITIALLPALLFYLSIATSVYVVTARLNVSTQGNADAPSDKRLIEGVPFLIAVLALVYFLGVIQFGPMTSGMYAIGVLIVSQFAWQLLITSDRKDAFVSTLKNTLKGLQIGATTAAPIMVVLGAIAMIVEMIQVGDIVQTLTFAMLDISGGSLLLLLALAMALSLLFGMGMPTVAAYVVVAIFVGPAVTEYGLQQVFAHMFVFYFAILSAVTPPIALACVVGSGIAQSDFLGTCYEAIKISIPAFLLPYAFIINTELLEWTIMTPVIFAAVLVSMAGVIVSVQGYFTRPMSMGGRVLLAIGALAVIFSPSLYVMAVGVIIVFGTLGYLASPMHMEVLEETL